MYAYARTAGSIGFFISHDHPKHKYHQWWSLLWALSASESWRAKGQRNSQPQGRSKGKGTERKKGIRETNQGLACLLPLTTLRSDLGVCPMEWGETERNGIGEGSKGDGSCILYCFIAINISTSEIKIRQVFCCSFWVMCYWDACSVTHCNFLYA